MYVGIIGAGIAGLTVALRLVESGHSVIVLDKGRGVGGRTSTRRGNGVAFDHGAQYFTVRDPKFRDFLDTYVPSAAWSAWEGRFAILEGDRLVPESPNALRFVGVPGMNSIARMLAAGLPVQTETRVVRLTGSPGRWSLIDSDGSEFGPFDWVVTTAPPAQSAAILEGSSPIAGEAARVEMEPCFALMLAPSDGSILPFDGIRCHHPILGWAANDQSKPGRGPGPSIVIQSDHGWALDHLNEELEWVARSLRIAASQAFGVDLSSVGTESVHRWLYAKPVEPLDRHSLVDKAARLAVCGDWCLAAKVEGAFLSGHACARALLEQPDD